MTRYSERFDKDQPELFMDDVLNNAMATAASKIKARLLASSKEMGERAGEKALDEIMADVQKGLVDEIPEDVAEKLKELYAEESLIDIMVEEDKWYELTADCCDAFLSGMSDTWPNEIQTQADLRAERS